MTTKEAKALAAYLKARRCDDAELIHNGFHPITPIQLIDTIASAKEAINYSNYDCNNLDRILTYLLKYWEEHNIPMGDHIPETFESSLKQYK